MQPQRGRERGTCDISRHSTISAKLPTQALCLKFSLICSRCWSSAIIQTVLSISASSGLSDKILVTFLCSLHVGSGNPLSVEFSPYGFSPAGIGDGEVEAVFVQIVPEATCNDMA